MTQVDKNYTVFDGGEKDADGSGYFFIETTGIKKE